MNGHIGAAVPNFHILEYDADRLSWDHELFTHVPEIEDGYLVVPDRPGWGTEPNEDAILDHPPKAFSNATQISS
jgi:galactonate dehydratase